MSKTFFSHKYTIKPFVTFVSIFDYGQKLQFTIDGSDP